MAFNRLFPCPCCGYLVFDKPPGSNSRCPICYWKDDIVQLAFPTKAEGSNVLSLCDAQANFRRTNVSDDRFTARVRAPLPSDQHAHGWRSFDIALDPYLWWESPDDRGWWKNSRDRISLYWWQDDFWLVQETPGWRFLTAVPEGVPCPIDGIDVWKYQWRAEQADRAIVKDPQYGQLFRFSIYHIDQTARAVTFAAGEFSNGIWGFYVPSTAA